jgi:hypothetical protein
MYIQIKMYSQREYDMPLLQATTKMYILLPFHMWEEPHSCNGLQLWLHAEIYTTCVCQISASIEDVSSIPTTSVTTFGGFPREWNLSEQSLFCNYIWRFFPPERNLSVNNLVLSLEIFSSKEVIESVITFGYFFSREELVCKYLVLVITFGDFFLQRGTCL